MLSIRGIMNLIKDGVSRPVITDDNIGDFPNSGPRELEIQNMIPMTLGSPSRSNMTSTYGYVLPSPRIDENSVIESDLGVQFIPAFVCTQFVDIEDDLSDFIDYFDNKFKNSVQNRIIRYLSDVDKYNGNSNNFTDDMGNDLNDDDLLVNINTDLTMRLNEIPEYIMNQGTYYSGLGKIFTSSVKDMYMEDRNKKMKKQLEGYVTVAFVRGDE